MRNKRCDKKTQKTRLYISDDDLIYFGGGKGGGGHGGGDDRRQDGENIYKIKNIGVKGVK